MADGIKQCDAFTGTNRDYCIALSRSCSKQGEEGRSPIVLDLLDGTAQHFQSTSQCLSFAKFRTSLGAPRGFGSISPPCGNKDKTKPKTGSKKTGTKKPALSKDAALSRCNEVGRESSPEHKYCRQLIAICTSGDGPYRLPFRGKEIEAMGQNECLSLALYYSKASGYGPASGQGTSGAGISDSNWHPDGKTQFAATFYDVGFQPEETEDIQMESLAFLFNYDSNLRGIKAAIAYRLEKDDSGTYTIRYHIYREDAPKPEDLSDSDLDMSFTFKVDGNVIAGTLAFGITLYNEGDFDSLNTIEIVKLD